MHPEGGRAVVIFPYAAGEARPRSHQEAYSKAYGRAVASVHNTLDDFSSKHIDLLKALANEASMT